MVDGVVSVQQDLGNGHDFIALAQQVFDDAGQGLGGVQPGVVKEDDAAGLHFGGNPVINLVGGNFFPVQTVPAGHKGKALGRRKRMDAEAEKIPCISMGNRVCCA